MIRWATLGSCLYSSKDTFIARDERIRSAASDFRLAESNLWNIRPNTSQVHFISSSFFLIIYIIAWREIICH